MQTTAATAPGSLPNVRLAQRSADGARATWWVWPTLFVLHFFLPYIPGTRFRVEVLTLLCSVGVFLTWVRCTTAEAQLALLTALGACWSLLRMGMLRSPDGVTATAIQWINLNFLFLATCLYLLCRTRLQQRRQTIVKLLLLVGSVNNLVALMQCYRPEWWLNSIVFEYYGGTINANYDSILTRTSTQEMSNAEFLARMAGRYSGILVSSHMLSVLNVWVCGAGIALLHERRPKASDRLLAVVAIALGLSGGMLSGGKMFYVGLIALFAVYLLMTRRFSTAAGVAACGAALLFLAPLFLSEGSDVRRQLEALWEGRLYEMLATRYDRSEGYLASTIERFRNDRQLLLFGTGAQFNDIVVADSLFLLPLASGGVIELALYLLPILWLLVLLWRRCNRGDEQLTMQFCMHAVFLLAGIGVPVYQMGRLAPLFWIVALTFAFSPVDLPTTPVRQPRPMKGI